MKTKKISHHLRLVFTLGSISDQTKKFLAECGLHLEDYESFRLGGGKAGLEEAIAIKFDVEGAGTIITPEQIAQWWNLSGISKDMRTTMEKFWEACPDGDVEWGWS